MHNLGVEIAHPHRMSDPILMSCSAGQRAWALSPSRASRPCLRASAHRPTGTPSRADDSAVCSSHAASRIDGECRLPPAAAAAEASSSTPSSDSLLLSTLNRRQLGGAALSAAAAAVVGTAPLLAAAAAPSAEPPAAAARLREAKMVMRVTALRGTVPQQWVADFQAAMEGFGVVALTQRAQLADVYAELAGNRATKGKPTTVDAVTLGDTWLQRAIVAGLIQPIPEARRCRWWARLHPRWQRLVCRSAATGLPDPRGEVWAAPYRWGAMLVAYRTDRLARAGMPEGIRDWADLLAPQLQGRVAFIDSPRDVVGVALKTLGLGFNASVAEAARCGLAEEDLRTRVQRLVKQVRVFSSSDHLRALAAGEVDVVVGWSDEVLPVVQRTNNLEAAAPLSGTSLFADCWCIPAAAAGGAEDGEASPLLPAWLELGLQPVHAQRSKGLRGGASPLLLPDAPAPRRGARACSLLEPAAPPPGSSQLDQLLPSEEVLQRSEFLLPLDRETASLYRRLLQA